MNQTLITSSSFTKDDARAQLVRLWADVLNKLTPPDWPVILFDNDSPISAASVLADKGFVELKHDEPWAPHIKRAIVVNREPNKYLLNGSDHCTDAILSAVTLGASAGMEYALYLESDMILARKPEWIVDRMQTYGMLCTSAWSKMHDFVETNIMGFHVKQCAAMGLVEAWRAHERRGGEWPEIWFEKFFGDNLHILPLRGDRDDRHELTRLNCLYAYPRGWDYLTHCDDLAVYRELLARNGVEV